MKQYATIYSYDFGCCYEVGPCDIDRCTIDFKFVADFIDTIKINPKNSLGICINLIYSLTPKYVITGTESQESVF